MVVETPIESVLLLGEVTIGVDGAAGAEQTTEAPAVEVANNLLGEPVPEEVTAPHVEELTNAFRISRGVAVGLTSNKSAAAPATCGVAIEVPL
ncbi:unannotated protein [freshwater metagenome]|uniref:Unannotated protein n=1 Tax=freshwater metagenome TaxID=449393 RepID=A0A6J7ES73_9ZZZZ